ncbi:anaphase-promoting complex subunit 10-like [Pollicipes pollicipes]|uniref:anaphase-promoting complex subunit 10-like n=1 Tax=Pollicipes pollicipes TaxID=41117 RepID=UPI00188564B1|nr:anaphase-promoting complex subunit 10-like [Pollicipes pollicipes]
MASMLPPDVIEEYDPYKEERLGRVREVGNQAVWSLSTCKPGFGVDQLRDHCLETYWQSDGPQPHLINIQFKRKTTIQQVCIYSDFKQDESYTPNRVSIRAGTSFHDLRELEVKELTEPSGWVVFALRGADDRPLRTYHVQIAVITNHQNGRDTHMRQVRVHAPVEQRGVMVDPVGSFVSVECSQFACVR